MLAHKGAAGQRGQQGRARGERQAPTGPKAGTLTRQAAPAGLALGTGLPLPANERRYFEDRLQADLSAVRIHPEAEAAHSLGANAFAAGRDIGFAPGRWQPGTHEGRRLLGHELAHVLEQAQHIARTAVEGLVAKAKASGEKGWGVFGVELFVLTDGNVLFNEVSPRPHDTGMVTMASQRLSEFALHARAILGLPITQEHVALSIPQGTVAASHAIVVQGDGEAEFRNVAAALAEPGTDLRIFAKPEVHGHRRMAVALAIGGNEADARAKAGNVAESLDIAIV